MTENIEQLRIADLILDGGRQRLTRRGQRIEVTGLSFRMLHALARKWPRTLSRRQLARAVWGDVVVSDDAVRQRVRLLRRALGNAGYITSVKGLGYRLTGPVQHVPSRRVRPGYWLGAALLAAVAGYAYIVLGAPGFEVTHEVRHMLRH